MRLTRSSLPLPSSLRTALRGAVCVAAAYGLLCGGVLMRSVWAAPACTPGQPCDTPLTANDPDDDSDGPNASGAPNAAKSTSSYCDADLQNQIYARALLHAERETVYASAILLKPDSVLEYTCADQAVSAAVSNAPNSFSSDDTTMGDHVENLVYDGLSEYIDANFAHDLLGGAAAGDDYDPSSNPSASYTCSVMHDVWMIAKCSDFGLEAPFMSFEELLSTDPRQRPEACSSMPNISQEIIDLSKNVNWEYAAFDQVDAFLEIFRSGADECENDTPIPTGLTINNIEMGTDLNKRPTVVSGSDYSYEDKVCSNPGCYFDHKGNGDPSDDECVAAP